MKKVSFMKLNIQQENVLSKEERKSLLGGNGPYACYVTCNPGSGSGGVVGTNSCAGGYPGSTAYGCGTARYCICAGNLVWGSM